MISIFKKYIFIQYINTYSVWTRKCAALLYDLTNTSEPSGAVVCLGQMQIRYHSGLFCSATCLRDMQKDFLDVITSGLS